MPAIDGTASVSGKLNGNAYVITLASAHGGNRLGVAEMKGFITELERALDAGPVLLVIQSTGEDFCLGRLQGEIVDGMSRQDSLRLILRANELLYAFPGVSVAFVQGRAYGFGAGVAAQCDITVAAADARFAFDEVQHGLAPLVVAEYMPRYVGHKRALQLVLTGVEFDAETARSDGMISEVVPADELGTARTRVLGGLSEAPAGALRLMKHYTRATEAGRLEDPRADAVIWLDDWLSAGRPDHPVP